MNKLPQLSMEKQKFTTEWIDYHFKRVVWFFYIQVCLYVPFMFSLMQLIQYDDQEPNSRQFYIYIF